MGNTRLTKQEVTFLRAIAAHAEEKPGYPIEFEYAAKNFGIGDGKEALRLADRFEEMRYVKHVTVLGNGRKVQNPRGNFTPTQDTVATVRELDAPLSRADCAKAWCDNRWGLGHIIGASERIGNAIGLIGGILGLAGAILAYFRTK